MIRNSAKARDPDPCQHGRGYPQRETCNFYQLHAGIKSFLKFREADQRGKKTCFSMKHVRKFCASRGCEKKTD